jgi:hypothetical protein
MRLGTRHSFAVSDLEAAIADTLSMSPLRLAELGARGRAWFEETLTRFERRLDSMVAEVLAR